ncbi:MAG: RNA polymerase sigma factor [Stenotrophomonas indicatrix]|jgi:RNA polymerase sigma-70 factor (ECF subfamily)|uniref:RNA polymerase sigma factor n=1 Tax=Stenotrophomonas indicatrix TaxID=2045451 RepID=A0ABT8Q9D4_9GAMM|nr:MULTISPECIES: RNA polymerase sigma factor [Stenotrophomonas]EVT72675.1 RNA polymerase sigma factor [Stenotrophomonas maltophilia 5BA-I-2]PJL13057.1 RNA polymerase subunit sigma [Stenotrophomonas maltophilia]AVJ33432.1 RNA polymerase sigma factor [Stenotrophomonas sp. MYb57]MCK6231315.1 RNA polymerase sigma factor [Stenotrophomonas indicatrix]MDF2479847.1 polymerase sigma factor [Stenotrophomonas indicatrix]
MSPNALALIELLIRERRALSRFIARYLDPASTEDTLQNLYLKASSVPGDPPILEPRGYLYRMAYHHALNRSQADARERRAMAEYASDLADASTDGQAQALDQAQLREISQTILALPPQVRECFVLNRYLGLSEREIAERLGISKSVVGKYVMRAALLIQQHQRGSRA